MPTQLTKKIVASAQPKPKPYELRDTLIRGLILRVQPSGHKAWIVTWAHGKRRTLGPASVLSLEQARAHARQALAEAVQEGLPALAKRKPSSCTLRAFLTDRYRAWACVELRQGERYVQRMLMVFSELLKKQLHEIDAELIDQWWQRRLRRSRQGRVEPITKATASRDLACLRAALSKAVEWKLIDRNPLLGLRNKSAQPRKIIRYLSEGEEARLRSALAARDARLIRGRTSGNCWRKARNAAELPALPADGFGDHLTPIVLLAMNTGLRRGELLALTWADVDLEGRMLTVQAATAKSGRQRHIPLNDEAYSVLTRWRAQAAKQERLFAPRDIKTAWVKLLKTAQVANFRFHDLRHHFASRLVTAGVDLNTVRELLGHADMTMTLRYAHLAPEHLSAAVAKLTVMRAPGAKQQLAIGLAA